MISFDRLSHNCKMPIKNQSLERANSNVDRKIVHMDCEVQSLPVEASDRPTHEQCLDIAGNAVDNFMEDIGHIFAVEDRTRSLETDGLNNSITSESSVQQLREFKKDLGKFECEVDSLLFEVANRPTEEQCEGISLDIVERLHSASSSSSSARPIAI